MLTDFGFQKVPIEEKAKKVAAVFQSVANRYDLMNDLMSGGLHRYWKRVTIEKAAIQAGERVLDLAGGTGDLAEAFVKRVGDKGHVVLADINEAMLIQGRNRMIDEGIFERIVFAQADAESLPFDDDYFDCITIAFGLRNVTRKEKAISEMARTLKPGGRLLILEFSKPVSSVLEKIYDAYSFKVIPKIGEWVTGDRESYQYLVESIRRHPNQEALKNMILENGFDAAEFYNLSGGVVALHQAWKY